MLLARTCCDVAYGIHRYVDVPTTNAATCVLYIPHSIQKDTHEIRIHNVTQVGCTTTIPRGAQGRHTTAHTVLCGAAAPQHPLLKTLTDTQLQQMSDFLDILLETNKHLNLTGARYLVTAPSHMHTTVCTSPP